MRILAPARATLSSLRTCRTRKTVVKYKFWMWPSNPFVTSDLSEAQNCGKMDIFDRTKPDYCEKLRWNGRFWPDWTGLRWKTVVKWTFLTGLNRTTVENCGKMDVVVFLWWCFCGGEAVFLWWCSCEIFVVVWWCFCGCVCGGVLVVMFLWWCSCGGVFVVVWWCGGVFVVVLRWCFCWCCFCGGGVFVVVFLWWCCVVLE